MTKHYEKTKPYRYNLQLPPELFKRVELLVEEEGITAAQFIRSAIRLGVLAYENKAKIVTKDGLDISEFI